jgi:hypothetical protein
MKGFRRYIKRCQAIVLVNTAFLLHARSIRRIIGPPEVLDNDPIPRQLKVGVPDPDLTLIHHSERMLIKVRDPVPIKEPGYLRLPPTPQSAATTILAFLHSKTQHPIYKKLPPVIA